MGRAAPDIPDGMRVLHGRFARWRKSNTGRLPIPDPLWAAAAEMAREQGVFRTAKVLSLEYGKLKRRNSSVGAIGEVGKLLVDGGDGKQLLRIDRPEC